MSGNVLGAAYTLVGKRSWKQKRHALDVPRSNCSDELVHLPARVLAVLAVGDVLCVWASVVH